MKIPFRQINQALKKEFGNSVKLKRNRGDYPFTLWFADDNPNVQMTRRAKAIVSDYNAIHMGGLGINERSFLVAAVSI